MNQSELTDFATRYAAAWSSQNPEELASLYAENGSLRVNEGDPSVGREAIADKARLPAKLITATAKDVVAQFDDAWSNESGHLPFPDDVRSAIERHRKTLAI